MRRDWIDYTHPEAQVILKACRRWMGDDEAFRDAISRVSTPHLETTLEALEGVNTTCQESLRQGNMRLEDLLPDIRVVFEAARRQQDMVEAELLSREGNLS